MECEAREATHRKLREGESEEEVAFRLTKAEAEKGLVEDSRRRAVTAGLAHDVAHVMRLEYGKAKGYQWMPDFVGLAVGWLRKSKKVRRTQSGNGGCETRSIGHGTRTRMGKTGGSGPLARAT